MTPTELSTLSYSASVRVNGRPVAVYGFTIRPLGTSTCYIEATPGAEYTVHYASRRAPGEAATTDLAVALDLDGHRMALQRVQRSYEAPVGDPAREGKFEGFRTTSTTIKPFLFRHSPSGATSALPLGKISLKWYRVRIDGVNTSPKLLTTPSSSTQAALGAARPANEKEHLRYTWLDSRDNPFESIEFIYATREYLVQQGFIAPSNALPLEAPPATAPASKPRFKPTFVPVSLPESSSAATLPPVAPAIPPPPPPREAAQPEEADSELLITPASASHRQLLLPPSNEQIPTKLEEHDPAPRNGPSRGGDSLARPVGSPAVEMKSPRPAKASISTPRPLPNHLRPLALRVPPPTPPPRAPLSCATVLATPEDVKPTVTLVTTPSKPCARALVSALRGPPAAPSPRTRANELEQENNRMRVEIAELENCKLKRRLKELRAEAAREGCRNASAEREKRRRVEDCKSKEVKKVRKALEVLVLD